jgi:hypothetical protein
MVQSLLDQILDLVHPIIVRHDSPWEYTYGLDVLKCFGCTFASFSLVNVRRRIVPILSHLDLAKGGLWRWGGCGQCWSIQPRV